jgi:aspartyl-tRNA(Asn)/glutamyl-tRNA(Gln) amidotransferase subunit A
VPGRTAGSLQIACRGYDEAMALRVALRVGHAYQQATEWHLQAPPT